MIIKATALAFFAVIIISIFVTLFAFSFAPWLSEWFASLLQSEMSYNVIPPPFTEDLFLFIFLNNVGHFWNPVKMLVWTPFFGAFILGLELLFNGVLIGVLSVMAGVTGGIHHPIMGLMPHGVFEIPAFVLQFASLIRWHITAVEMMTAMIFARKTNRTKFKQGIKDAAILAVASVILFMVAAFIETYITPYLLGI